MAKICISASDTALVYIHELKVGNNSTSLKQKKNSFIIKKNCQ